MKKALLLLLLVAISSYSQDHYSGITTSKRVGILNIGLNPSELANLNNHFEIQLFSTSLNVSNNELICLPNFQVCFLQLPNRFFEFPDC